LFPAYESWKLWQRGYRSVTRERIVTPELIISVRASEDVCVVVATGEIDMASAAKLTEALANVHGRVVVDLAGVSFLDSSGISALVHARNRLHEERGELSLRNPRDNVRAVLKVVGLSGWIE
jgi:anti-anti-sigma factor